MTVADVVRTLVRRWYALAVGLCVTAVVGVFMGPGQHLYTARTSVVFLWPGSVSLSRTEDGGLGALVNFAAMVRWGVAEDDGQALASASFGGTLAGAGVRNGYTVLLPNSGGQWSQTYDQPKLAVEAVAASPELARSEVRTLLQQINSFASLLQARQNVPLVSRVTTSTASIEIDDTGVTASTRTRGVLGLAALGLLLSTIGAVSLDRLLGHASPRRDRRRRSRGL